MDKKELSFEDKKRIFFKNHDIEFIIKNEKGKKLSDMTLEEKIELDKRLSNMTLEEKNEFSKKYWHWNKEFNGENNELRLGRIPRTNCLYCFEELKTNDKGHGKEFCEEYCRTMYHKNYQELEKNKEAGAYMIIRNPERNDPEVEAETRKKFKKPERCKMFLIYRQDHWRRPLSFKRREKETSS
ncbi:MAG: hypothetical protein FJ356_03850 [Thaumarchaeota archaeon]|nr:hypothetical protein [Nitrososphaerota archaeon]